MSTEDKDQKKEDLDEKNWHDQASDEDESEEEEKVEEKAKKPKQEILKDKHGEILITKLDDYIEPEKQVK